MNIWLDADACPRDIRAIAIRAALQEAQRPIKLYIVADRPIPLSASSTRRHENFRSRIIPVLAPDADAYILQYAENKDVAITRDVELASELDKGGVICLDIQGCVWDRSRISERIELRNTRPAFRSKSIGARIRRVHSERQTFAAALQYHIAR